MADSTAGCARRKSLNSAAPSLWRSASRSLPFLWKHDQIRKLPEEPLIFSRVESLVHADGGQLRKAPLAFAHHFDGHLIIAVLLHDLMMEDKTVLVFHDTDLQAQLDGDAGQTLGLLQNCARTS